MRWARFERAFTLIELIVVIALLGVLSVIIANVASGMRSRAERVQCMANVKSLAVAAEMYVQDNNQWPQISMSDDDEEESDSYAKEWLDALAPYKISAKTFICPTIQRLMSNPDYNQPANLRIDYMATPFDDKPMTPHQWPRQPWFVETGDVHGHGNLIIFTDGSISDLTTVAASASQ